MTLIVENTTNAAVEFIDLGLTVPALGTYDLTSRPASVLVSSEELANAISTGNIVVTSDTLNTLSTLTGYQQIASGTTADRPTSPTPGTTRYNETTGHVEMFQAGNWQNMPNLRDVEFRADPATAILYRKVGGKYLSVTFSSLIYAHGNTADKSWIYIDANINNSMAGYGSAFYGTIVFVGAYTDTTGIDKSVSVYINDVEHANTVSFSGLQTSNSVATSVDFDPGDTVRFRMRSPTKGKLGSMYITAFFCLRDPT